MKAYGKKLWWIEDQQYSDTLSTRMALPSSGKHRGKKRKRYLRPFKKMERQSAKSDILKYVV